MSEQERGGGSLSANREFENQPSLAWEVRALTMLHRLATLPAGETGLDPILSEIVQVAIVLSGAQFGNLQLLDADSTNLRIRAYSGLPQWYLDYWQSTGAGHGSCGTALERGERVVVE